MSESPAETSVHGLNPTTPQDPYFALSKLRTIAVIVAGVVIVGGLGAIAAIAFGNPDPQPRGTSTPSEPGVDSQIDPLGDLGSDGELSRGFKASSRSVTADAEVEERVTIGNDVKIPVPRGWRVDFVDEDGATLRNGKGTTFYAFTSTTEATDALSVVDDVALKVLPEQLYTKVKRFPPSRLETVGTMISWASFQYDASRTDLQASSHVYGYISIAIRPDKKVLVLNAEHSPPKEWDKRIESWFPIHDGASLSFAGIEPE